MVRAFVTPSLVSWARERRGLEVEVLASKINVKGEKLRAWEAGTDTPTFRQAQNLAKRLDVPFGSLFLSSPPSQLIPLPDFRTVADQTSIQASPELIDLLNDVINKQQWFREYQQSEGSDPLPFIGRYDVDSEVETIAADIVETLAIDETMRRKSPNWEGFLREFIRNAEEMGILVLRSGIVKNNPHRPLDVAEFRGFAISDDIAPLVFLNGKDAKSAQIFTLAHEIAHLWIGESGISNPNYRVRSTEQGNSVESLCNRVAAETLVPSEDFKPRWQNGVSPIEQNLQILSARYRVSRIVILRKAFDLNLVSTEIYWEYFNRLMGPPTHMSPPTSENGGGNFYPTLLARNSNLLTTVLIANVAEGNTLRKEAARLLNVRIKTLSGIAKYLYGDVVTIA